ncbi:MAG TPA: sulfite exporter TauE/SafE family protein [Polyangiales bacterium]
MIEAFVAGATLGLISLPHCVAMCGPLAAFACTNTPQGLPAVRYQLGRTVAYVFLGALCGRLGQVLTTAGAGLWPRVVFSLLAAGACVFTARRLWRGSEPNVGLVQLRTGRGASLFEALSALVPRDPAALGLLSGLLPCGALATALLAASATSAPVVGALLMFGFVTASAPALLGAGLIARAWPAARTARLRRPLAVLFVACALVFVARPLQAFSAGPRAGHVSQRCH